MAAFENFKEVIQTAQKKRFPLEAKLILTGEIQYAAGKGDITLVQARELYNLIGDDIQTIYAEALDIATFGDTGIG